ncbi:MFS transporter [Novosphingobium colocasiae]
MLPGIVFLSISRWGYVGGYLTLAALILFISLPLAWAWVPAKSPPLPVAGAAITPESRWAMLRSPKVLVLCVAGALNYAPVVAILSQMVPIAAAKGLSAAAGVGAVSLVGLAALGGALLSGLLVDRFWAPGVAFILNILPAAGCLLLLPDQVHAANLYAAALLIGLGQGAELDLVAYMVARYFGLRTYATIYGLSVLTIGIMASLGISAIGLLFDHFGNYDLAMTIAAGSFGLAAFTYLLMGRYPSASLDS